MKITNELFNNLTEAEKEEVLKILGELSDEGSSKSYTDLLTKDYDENIPKLVNEKYFMFKNLDRYLTGIIFIPSSHKE